MPIRPEFRPLYRTKEWKKLRAGVLRRAKNRCEQCGKPKGKDAARPLLLEAV